MNEDLMLETIIYREECGESLYQQLEEAWDEFHHCREMALSYDIEEEGYAYWDAQEASALKWVDMLRQLT